MPYRLPALFVLATAIQVLAACDRAREQRVAFVPRDSAGVQIVENSAPALDRAWTVSDEPSVQIGAVQGAREYLFNEIMGMTRLSDGRIVVADMGNNELRFYDAAGRFLKAVGRKGQGPGEFTQIRRLYRLSGDSLLVSEFRPRVQLFAPDGSLVRMIRVGSEDQGPLGNSIIGVFSDGSLLASTRIRPMPGVPMPDASTLLHLDSDGQTRDTVGSFRAVQWGGGSVDRPHPLVFGARGHTAVAGESFYHGFSDRYDIGHYRRDGTLARRVRRAWAPQPVGDFDVETYRDSYLGMSGEGGRAVPDRLRDQRERNLSETGFAEHHPAHSDMLVDHAGNLWVQEYSIAHNLARGRFQPTFAEPSRWSVFDDQGRWLTDVTLPGNLRVMEIGEDYVLGLARDDLGVEYVRLHQLRKG